jgi:small subunit ribosomal protein S17
MPEPKSEAKRETKTEAEKPAKAKKTAPKKRGPSERAVSKKEKDIGLDVPVPTERCSDPKCPFHGEISVRGAVLDGEVVTAKMQGTVVVRREGFRYVQKYERFEHKSSRLFAHLPSCLHVKVGDRVTIAECRKVSKHVTFVVVANRSMG